MSLLDSLTTSVGFNVNDILSGGASKARRESKRALKDSYRIQRDFAPEVIKSQVEGYRAAGVHPLYAMGSGAQIGGPVAIGAPKTGIKGQVSSQRMRPEEVEATKLNNRILKLQGDLLQTQVDASTAAAPKNGATPIPLQLEDPIQYRPMSEKTPGQIGGDHPGWKKHNLSFGGYNLSVWAPAQETSEIFESITMWPVIYAANQNEIHRWAGDVLKHKSTLGKLGLFGKWLADMAGSKLK